MTTMIQNDITFLVPSIEPTLEQESIGTLILAKTAQLNGFKVNIIRFWEIDGNHTDYHLFKHHLVEKISSSNPRVVCCYCRYQEYHIILDVSAYLKTINPDIVISLGGPQAELVASITLQEFPAIDYVCCGEGENSIVKSLDFMLNHPSDENFAKEVPGLVFRNSNGEICENRLPSLIPNYYCRYFYYYDLIPKKVFLNSSSIGIDVGRGCPFSCSFCSTKTFWKQQSRLRNIDNTIDEIIYLKDNYGITRFSFEHDLFTSKKKNVVDFCNKLKEKNLNIQWNCSSRIDTIDHEMIDIMIESGLSAIYFGVESGSQKMQYEIHKNLNIDYVRDIVSYSVNRGLWVTTSFIYGFPNETIEDIEETLQLIYEFSNIGVKNVQIHRLSIDQGTEMYKQYANYLYFSDKNPIVRNLFGFPELTEIVKNNREIFSSFFDFHSRIRDSMNMLPLYNNLQLAFPKTFSRIIESSKVRGFHHSDLVTLFSNCCGPVLDKINDKKKLKSLTAALGAYITHIYIYSIFEVFDSGNNSISNYEKIILEKTFYEEINHWSAPNYIFVNK